MKFTLQLYILPSSMIMSFACPPLPDQNHFLATLSRDRRSKVQLKRMCANLERRDAMGRAESNETPPLHSFLSSAVLLFSYWSEGGHGVVRSRIVARITQTTSLLN